MGHFAANCPTKRILTVEQIRLWEEEAEIYDIQQALDNPEPCIKQQPLDVASPDQQLFIVRHILHAAEPEPTTQRETIFQSRCNIGDLLCRLIIDSGSCTNVAAKNLVDRLKPPTRPHPIPYKIKWLDNSNSLDIRQQAQIDFTLGAYSDSIWCDILPMTACQLLLGRPWQFNKKAIHNGEANTYTIVHGPLKIELQPLPPDTGPTFPATMLLNRTKGACQPRHRKRRKTPKLQLLTPRPLHTGAMMRI